MYPIPIAFQTRMVEVYGEPGRDWIEKLPAMIDEFGKRWSLKIGEPFPLSYNFVAPVSRKDGTEAVLKIGVPNRELLSEIHALQLYNGNAIAKLYDVDFEQQAFLIERINPGNVLESIKDDEKRTRIAAQVMQKLWIPISGDHPLLTVESWTAGLKNLRLRFNNTSGPFPEYLVDGAERIFSDFVPSQGERVLLHGDLHHWNILKATRRPWLALDPKGVIGEREYEVGALLRNPDLAPKSREDIKNIQDRRVSILTEMLNFDRERMLGWGFSQAVLSALWSMEDHGTYWEPPVKCAEVLFEMWRGN